MALDRAMSYECVAEWLPDFVAFADRPDHPDADALYARATTRVRESYASCAGTENISGAGSLETEEAIAEDVIEVLLAVAEMVVGRGLESWFV